MGVQLDNVNIPEGKRASYFGYNLSVKPGEHLHFLQFRDGYMTNNKISVPPPNITDMIVLPHRS